MRLYKVYNYFFVLLCSIVFSSLIQGKTTKPPIYVHYGLFVKKLSVDFKESTFHSEFYWWAIFTNDSTKTGISNDDIL